MKNLSAYLLILFFLIASSVFGAKQDMMKRPAHALADTGIIIIPFDYKQSALYLPHTFEVMDSVVNILFKNDRITLSVYGYTHVDEGNDTIRKYLGLNRALFVRDYILGRGVNENRLLLVKGMNKVRSVNSDVDKDGHSRNCRAELVLNYPPPPPPVVFDKDEDGIPDSTDACAEIFGYAAKKGCADSNAIIIPFETEGAWLANKTYNAMDSTIKILKTDPLLNVSIEGHAYRDEGTNNFCNAIAEERAIMVKRYLLSRNIAASRIISVQSYGSSRPVNTGKTPLQKLQNARVQLFITGGRQ